MSKSAVIRQDVLFVQDFTGPNSLSTSATPIVSTDPSRYWAAAYHELFRPMHHGSEIRNIAYWYTSPTSFELVGETLPVLGIEGPSEALACLDTIQTAFGDSASDLAKMLRVSRQMIYHYRQGMEPALDNFRRMKLIGNLASEVSSQTLLSLKPVLKSPQPEGKTLLAFLSEESPNVATLRRILHRAGTDLTRRQRLATSLAYATRHDREDIMRTRHAEGKPIYVTDLDVPGKIIQIRADKSRVRGRIMNRVFIPDEE